MVKTKDTKEKTKVIKVAKGPMMNYPVGDFLIRVKNAAMSGKKEVITVNTKLVLAVANVLKSEGFLGEVKVTDNVLTVTIARRAKQSMLLGLVLISRPGLRQYLNVSELSKKRGPEIYILSTPQGVMSSKQALKKVVGGEVIAKVW